MEHIIGRIAADTRGIIDRWYPADPEPSVVTAGADRAGRHVDDDRAEPLRAQRRLLDARVESELDEVEYTRLR